MQFTTLSRLFVFNRHSFVATFILCICLLCLSGCFTPAKLDKWVAHDYQDVSLTPVKSKLDYLGVTDTIPSLDNRVSSSVKKSGKLLPLLFYWHQDYKYICTLNARIPVNNFITAFTAYAGSKRLKQKLNGRRLELTINNVPHVLTLEDNEHMIWFILYAYSWTYLDILPGSDDLVLSYKIIDGGSDAKDGTIIVPDANKRLRVKMFQSPKKAIGEYLEQYNDNITAMSRKAVDKLITAL
jgi:hypothetical protein